MGIEGIKLKDYEDPEADQRRALESIFGKSLRCFKRWGKVGVVVGAAFVAGEVAKTYTDDFAYHKYVSSFANTEQLKQKEINEAEINKIFGSNIVQEINNADQKSFLKRKEERKEPKIEGFENTNFTNEAKYLISEKYGYYPKGWVDGQVDKVQFVNSVKKISEDQIDLGVFRGGIIYLYINEHKKGIYDKNSFPIESETISHELAHANDWNSDLDLSILDRQSEILAVYNRLMSPDAYDKENQDSGYLSYLHEYQHRGLKDSLFIATSEYWAQICAEYFENPETFLKNHPKDFKLVDTYVKKNDPSFDVFSKNRQAHNPNTSESK